MSNLANPFEHLADELQAIKSLLQQTLLNSNSVDSGSPKSIWMDLDELINYLPNKPAKATLYNKLSNGEIPGYKEGKKWYFKRTEIDAYLNAGKIKTSAEIQEDIEDFMSNKKRLPNGK